MGKKQKNFSLKVFMKAFTDHAIIDNENTGNTISKQKDCTAFSKLDANLNEEFNEWTKYFNDYNKYMKKNFYFLNVFFAGLLGIKAELYINDDYLYRLFDNSRTDYDQPKRNIKNILEDDEIFTSFDNIHLTKAALATRILLEIQNRVFDKMIDNRNEYFEELKMISESYFPEIKMDSINILENDKKYGLARLFSLIFFLSIKCDIQLCNTLLLKEYDKSDYNCFNPDFNIYNGFEGIDYYKASSVNGLLGAGGSLNLLKIGLDFVKKPDEEKCDALTLLTLADVFYYDQITHVNKSLEKAYICSLYAYKRKLLTAAYNLGYYSYILATDYDNCSQEFKDLNSLIRRNGYTEDHLTLAINFFIEASKANNPYAFNSLGNICQKLLNNGLPQRINDELESKIYDFAQNVCESFRTSKNDSNYYLIFKGIYGENKCFGSTLIFYKQASNVKSFDGMYNYCRILEMRILEIINRRLTHTNDDEKELNFWISELTCYLRFLKDYKHPKGTNIYLEYYCFLKFKNDNGLLSDKFYKKNPDFIPKLLNASLTEKNISIDFKKDDEIKDINDVIDCFKTVSSFKAKQLLYFWPCYHYALLAFHKLQSQDFDREDAPNLLSDLHKLLIQMLDPYIIKKEPFGKQDRNKAILLLLQIANYESSTMELTSVEKALLYKEIESLLPLKNELSAEIKREFNKLQKWYNNYTNSVNAKKSDEVTELNMIAQSLSKSIAEIKEQLSVLGPIQNKISEIEERLSIYENFSRDNNM